MNDADYLSHKVFKMEEEKRDRILSAAMHEFRNGYEKASTDHIVREAGISKGLLFHYFGSKEKLYSFVIRYAFETVMHEYYELINTKQSDVLEILWQTILLKRDLSYRYPGIFEFITRVYSQTRNDNTEEIMTLFKVTQGRIMNDLYTHFDRSLFKECLDADKAVSIIWWTLTGYAEALVDDTKNLADYQQNYDQYLAEIKSYFDIFKKCFYK